MEPVLAPCGSLGRAEPGAWITRSFSVPCIVHIDLQI
jgi:hypothetical protein